MRLFAKVVRKALQTPLVLQRCWARGPRGRLFVQKTILGAKSTFLAKSAYFHEIMTFSSKGAPWRPLGADGTWCNGKWMLFGATFANFLILDRKVRKVRKCYFFTYFSLFAHVGPKKWKWAKSWILDGIPFHFPWYFKGLRAFGRNVTFSQQNVFPFIFHPQWQLHVTRQHKLMHECRFPLFLQHRKCARSPRTGRSTWDRPGPWARVRLK